MQAFAARQAAGPARPWRGGETLAGSNPRSPQPTTFPDATRIICHGHAEADNGHFLVAYPDGLNRAWNAGTCCGEPQRANTDDVGASISKRAEASSWHARHPELGGLTGLPVTDVCDLSAGGDYWYACLPADGTPPQVARDQLLYALTDLDIQ